MVATTIDSFVVELGLDPKKLTAGQRDAVKSFKATAEEARKQGTEIENAGKQAAQFLNRIRTEALSLAALFVGGIGLDKMITQFATADSRTGRFASTIGTSVEELSSWTSAIRTVGGSTETTLGTLQSMTRELQNFTLFGQSDLVPILRQMGILLRPGETITELFKEINKVLSKEDPRRAEAMASKLGLDRATFDLLRMAPEEVNKRLAESLRLTKEQSDAAASLQHHWANAQTAMERFSASLLTHAVNPLNAVIDKFTNILNVLNLGTGSIPDVQRRMAEGREKARREKPWIQQAFEWELRALTFGSLFPGTPAAAATPPAGGTDFALRGGGRRHVEFGGQSDPWQTGTARIPPYGARGAGLMSPTNNTSEVNINSVNVYTNATDAEGIARDFGAAMRRFGLGVQANSGQQG